jgi:nucleoside phosphorylase
LISGDTFITDPSTFHPDLAGFAAEFVDMELASIAHTLYRNRAQQGVGATGELQGAVRLLQ